MKSIEDQKFLKVLPNIAEVIYSWGRKALVFQKLIYKALMDRYKTFIMILILLITPKTPPRYIQPITELYRRDKIHPHIRFNVLDNKRVRQAISFFRLSKQRYAQIRFPKSYFSKLVKRNFVQKFNISSVYLLVKQTIFLYF